MKPHRGHSAQRLIVGRSIWIGLLTGVSRVLGIIREILLTRYFGIGVSSDVFITAFKIPNFFRHIFAEGALSASFIPTFVRAINDRDTAGAAGLMTLSFLFFEGLVLALYALVVGATPTVVQLVAPGFDAATTAAVVPMLRIIFPFLLFVSSSALLAGGLQAIHHFTIPASGSAIWNLVFCSVIYAALVWQLPATIIAYGTVLGGIAMLVAHLVIFFYQGLRFGPITRSSVTLFRTVLRHFFPSLVGVSIVEINLFVAGMVASYLPGGAISLIHYASRFRHIPVGIFGVALATTLLPHFSRIVLYAPSRLSFYLLETIKYISWLMIPVTLYLCLVAHTFFGSILIGHRGSSAQIDQATLLFIIFAIGIVFVCINKALLSMLYALQDTSAALWASGVSALVNLVGDIVGMLLFQAPGIACASVAASMTLTGMLIYRLHTRHGIVLDLRRYSRFMRHYCLRLIPLSFAAYGTIMLIFALAEKRAWSGWIHHGIGYWIVTTIVSGGAGYVLWRGRRQVYFVR